MNNKQELEAQITPNSALKAALQDAKAFLTDVDLTFHQRIVGATRLINNALDPSKDWTKEINDEDRAKNSSNNLLDRVHPVSGDDPDHGIMVFDDEVEARAAFEKKNTNWNCYLFRFTPRPKRNN